MTTDPFNPADSAAAIVKSDPPNKDKPKSVNHAAVPRGSKPINHPVAKIQPASSFPPPGDPYWKSNPIITEHKDGTVRRWGEDTTKNPNTLPKQMLPPTPDMSDKAKGYSNTYYPINH